MGSCPGRRWRMRIGEPKPARRSRHCTVFPTESTWRGRLVQPQGPSHRESLVQASGHSSPSPAWLRAGGRRRQRGGGVRGRSNPKGPLSGECDRPGTRRRAPERQAGSEGTLDAGAATALRLGSPRRRPRLLRYRVPCLIGRPSSTKDFKCVFL